MKALAALAALACAAAIPGGAARADTETAVSPPLEPSPEVTSKKDATWAAKQQPRKPLRTVARARLVGKKPAPVISLFNTWTHEWVAIEATAKALPRAVSDRLLRCHFTNQPTAMDGRLSRVILDAARHFRSARVHIVSGFRAPKYNLMLRKKGRRVARESEHTKGHAVDFWLPGVPTQRLYDWALRNAVGGVGLYISDGFVHMDVGRRRTWTDP